LGGEVSSESAPHDTVGTVGPADLAPVDSVFVSVFVGDVSLCDKGNPFSQVKVDLVLGIHSPDFQQTHVGVLGSETALVSEDGGIYVKAWGSLL